MASSVPKTSTSGSAKPAVKPKPKPVRRPVVPRKPPVRKPTRDPRDHPWRKKPAPKPRPKSPRIPKRKGNPFGRRPAFQPGRPVTFRKWPFNRPMLDRYAGGIIGGGMLGVAIGYVLNQPAPDLAAAGWCLACSLPGRLEVYSLNNQLNTGQTPCAVPSTLCGTGGQVYIGAWPAAIPAPSPNARLGAELRIGQMDANPTRATWQQVWRRKTNTMAQGPHPGVPLPPLQKVPKVIPIETMPLAEPQWWAQPLPLTNEPLPDAPAVRPRPQPRPKPNPQTIPALLPVGVVPSVDIDTNLPRITGGVHEQRPPRDRERERKKKLSPSDAARWLRFLAKMGGSFTEIDDFVASIYRALPWALRRWRGRDGVWRERDHTTALRAQRVYEYLGEVDINKALYNIATNELQDRGLAALHNSIRDKALSQGYTYPTSGYVPSRMAENGEWWEIRKAQERRDFQEFWKKQYAPGTTYDGRPRWSPKRWIIKNVQDPKTGEWRKVRVERPETQIPWYKYQSNYSSRVPVLDSAGRIVAWKYVPGHYYGG